MSVVRPAGTNWLTLPIIMLVIPIGTAHVSSVAPFINEMSSDIGVSVSHIGQLGTAQFVGALVAAVALVPFVARIQLRKLLFWAAVTMAISTFLTASTLSFTVMFASRIFAGFAAGIAMAGAYAAMGRAWPDTNERNKRMGFLVAALWGGTGILAPAMRLIAGPTSWQTATFVLAAVVGLIALLVLIALPALDGAPGEEKVPLSKKLSDSAGTILLPGIRPVLALRMLVWMATGVSLYYFPAFFISEYPGKEVWIGPFYAATSLIGFMAGSLANVALLSRVSGPSRILWVAGLVYPLGGIAFAWVTPNPVVTTVIFVAWAFAIGLHIPNCISLLYVFAGRQQSSAVFVDGAFQQIAAISGAIVGGLAIALAPRYLGWQWLLAIICVATLLPLFLVVRQARTYALAEASA